jgi:hypothetical protein
LPLLGFPTNAMLMFLFKIEIKQSIGRGLNGKNTPYQWYIVTK